MNAKERLAELIPQINAKISDILETEYNRSQHHSPIVAEFLKNMWDLGHGGKKLRGAFTYHSYLMFGGHDRDEILKVSAFIELMSTFILMHDDILDNDDRRRGLPTIHKIYRDYSVANFKSLDPVHFGQSMGILAGDILNFLSVYIFTQLNFDASRKLWALEKFYDGFLDTAYGETLDFFSNYLPEIDEDDVLQVHFLKTSLYTYRSPLFVGAILAGCKPADLDDLFAYAKPGGIAFQIQDDILGMFGDEERTGKAADSDLKEGKKTLLILKALEKAAPKDKEFINYALGNKKISAKDAEQVRKIITETGSLDYSKQLAQQFVQQAKANISHRTDWQGEGREFLDAVADYMINRDF